MPLPHLPDDRETRVVNVERSDRHSDARVIARQNLPGLRAIEPRGGAEEMREHVRRHACREIRGALAKVMVPSPDGRAAAE